MPKLRWSPTSPYVRKVMMLAIERGVETSFEKEQTDAWSPDTDLPKDNPLGKVPALVLDDGTVLFDSPVIAEYLDSLDGGPHLFPPAGPERWKALRLQAVGDGICDAAIMRRLESARVEGEKSQKWMDRYRGAVERSLDSLESEAGTLGDALTIGTVAVIVALAYLDFRFGHEPWREGRPNLAAWFAKAADRESVRLTAPPV